MDLKTISTLAAGLLLFAGCAPQAGFEIKGTLTGSIKDTLVLEEMAEKSLEFRSKIVTGEDGSFNYSDTAANPRLLFIRTQQGEYIPLLVMRGEKITVNAESGKINETLRITGSPQTELVLELNGEIMKATSQLDSLSRQYQELLGRGNDPQAETWIQGEYGKLMDGQRKFVRAFIERHAGEPASLLALSHQIGQQSVLNGRSDFDLFKKVDDLLYKKYPESVLASNLHKYVEAMRQQLESTPVQEKTTASGTEAPEISLSDPDGNIRTLTSLRGKIVLLDFWAGWCGPCRRENPNLVAAYAKYQDKGFEIYQVSLDKTKSEWVAAIQQDGLNWIHVSDLKFWNSPVARQYGIQSIPANFLLDKEGKIIARDLRGEALEEELAKLFR